LGRWRGISGGEALVIEGNKFGIVVTGFGVTGAEIPAIPGCYALMPTREEALTELAAVFQLIADEYAARGEPLHTDATAIVNG
jgi:hypothetical protein